MIKKKEQSVETSLAIKRLLCICSIKSHMESWCQISNSHIYSCNFFSPLHNFNVLKSLRGSNGHASCQILLWAVKKKKAVHNKVGPQWHGGSEVSSSGIGFVTQAQTGGSDFPNNMPRRKSRSIICALRGAFPAQRAAAKQLWDLLFLLLLRNNVLIRGANRLSLFFNGGLLKRRVWETRQLPAGTQIRPALAHLANLLPTA